MVTKVYTASPKGALVEDTATPALPFSYGMVGSSLFLQRSAVRTQHVPEPLEHNTAFVGVPPNPQLCKGGCLLTVEDTALEMLGS